MSPHRQEVCEIVSRSAPVRAPQKFPTFTKVRRMLGNLRDFGRCSHRKHLEARSSVSYDNAADVLCSARSGNGASARDTLPGEKAAPGPYVGEAGSFFMRAWTSPRARR